MLKNEQLWKRIILAYSELMSLFIEDCETMAEGLDPLPRGWILKECKDYPGKAYYYNEQLNFSTWHRPPNDQKYVYLQQICIKAQDSLIPKDRDGNDITRTLQEAKELIGSIKKDLEINTNLFSQLAEKYSDIYTKETCGTLGWVLPTQFPKNIATCIEKLQPGAVSSPQRTKIGFFIFKRLA